MPLPPAVASTPPAATAPFSAPSGPVSPLPVEEERRLVTALFCDLVGFTPLSESLDPEEVREIQTAYFAQMNGALHRFGGSVEKYAGDAVLALFGAPVAQEDDAERAVRCALAMQQAFQPVAEMAKREWGVDLAVRIGVNTGEAISGAWDVEGRRDYSATGDVVNTAARLQSSADPGGVIVGPETMRLARRSILFGERRDLTLKGKAAAFPAYPVAGLRERMAERWESREQRTPLIGRESELATLLDLWERARRDEGQILTVMAEAGVGKSRLLAEAIARVAGAGEVTIVRARCLSYGQQLSLHLLVDLLRSLSHLREGDDHDRVRVHLRETVDSLLAAHDVTTREAAIDVFGTVLGLPPSESAVTNANAHIRRRALVRSLRLLLAALAAYQPAVIVLEDLHWIDDASSEVLAELLPDVPDHRMLLLITQRSQWNARWSAWPQSQVLALQPLAENYALDLARATLGSMALAPDLERQVTERAGGNPFFIEELLLSLQESDDLVERDGRLGLIRGAAERLPSTLTEVLLARLDRLDRPARSVAQTGSVIGRSFAIRLLAHVSEQTEQTLEEPLSALHQAEIAFPRAAVEGEYVFKHGTVCEVAYNTLLNRRRQALHAAIARAITALYPVDERVEMIAYHFSRTKEHAEAAEWLERAADRAASVYANAAAIEHYGEARELIKKIGADPSVLARIDEKLGHTLKIVARYDEALEVLDRAAAAYVATHDAEGERRVVAEIGRVHRAHGTPDEGIARVTSILARDDGTSSTSGVASLHVALARLYFNLGRYQEQLEAASQGAELAGRIGDRRVLTEAEMSRSIALFLLGRTEGALAVMEATMPLAEAVGDFEVLTNLLGNTALIYRDMGDFERSREYRERSAQVAERMGDRANHSFAIASLGELSFFLGDWQEAEVYLDRAMHIIRSLSTSWFSSYPPIVLGQLHAAQGDFEAAVERLEEALAIAQKGGHRHTVRRVSDCLAEIDLIEGRPEQALRRYDGLLDLSALDEDDSSLTATLPVVAWARLACGDAVGAASLAAHGIKRAVEEHAVVELLAAQRVAGMAAAAQGAWAEAAQTFEQTLALAREIKYPYAQARASYKYGLMLVQEGKPAQAYLLVEEALAIFQHLGARPYVNRTQDLLAAIAP